VTAPPRPDPVAQDPKAAERARKEEEKRQKEAERERKKQEKRGRHGR
jgi:hypothetical protein